MGFDKNYINDLRNNTIENDKKSIEAIFSRYKCVICGYDDISFADRQQRCYYVKNDGTQYTQQDLIDTMIVCSEACRKSFVFQGRVPYRYLMEGVDIPPRYVKARLDWWKQPGTIKVYDYTTNWLNSDKRIGLYMFGPPGTGKTSLAVALMYELRKQELRVRFVSAYEFALAANDKALGRGDVRQFLQQYDEYDVVVFDDVAKHHLTDTAKEVMFGVFVHLYETETPVIFTSNYKPEQIADCIDERLKSRLSEMCEFLIMGTEDKRKNAGNNNAGK